MAGRTLRAALQLLDDAAVEEVLEEAARLGGGAGGAGAGDVGDAGDEDPGGDPDTAAGGTGSVLVAEATGDVRTDEVGSERDRLTVRVLLALALAEFEQHGLEAAQPPLDDAVRAAQTARDREMEALARSQHAMLLGRSGQVALALVELDRAAEHLEVLAPRDRCIVLLNRGMARSELRDLDRAREDFAAARRTAHEHGLHRTEFMATHNLGYAAYLAGDLPAALTHMAEASAIETDVSRAEARLDQGRVMLEAGLVTEAVEALGEAVALCTDRQHQVRSEAELELSRALAQRGDLGAADRAAGAARRRFARRSTPLWADRAHLEQLQIRLARGGRTGAVESESIAMASRASVAQDPILTAHASLLAAEAADAGERTDQALAHAEAAASLRDTGSLTTRLRLDLVLASCAHRRGDQLRAARVLRGAAQDLHLSQGSTASLDLRTARGLHGVALAELDTTLALEHGAAAVLATTERWRNASATLPDITPPGDAVLAGLLTELRGVRTRLREESLPPAEASGLRERHGQLQRRIRLRDWAIRGSGEHRADATVSVRVVRRELVERDVDLVSFVAHRGDLLSVTVVRGRATLRHLGPLAETVERAARVHADLQALATHGTGPMGSVLERSLTSQLERVEAVLLQGIPRDRALVVVPTSDLAQLPWGMLPLRRGNPTTVAASAGAWARRPYVAAAHPRVAAVAGPGLRVAEHEADEVARLWDVVGVPPGSSTAADLRTAFSDNEIVHVAAHGRHDKENPLFSSLRLDDGPLFAHELANTGVRARHVVLSACDVGQSTVRPGDEPLGMSAALLHLGATSVVAPVCPVPDEVASHAMLAYHHGLRDGLDAATALAAATDGPDLLARAFTLAGSPFRVAV